MSSRAGVGCVTALCLVVGLASCAGHVHYSPGVGGGMPALWPVDSRAHVVSSGFGGARGRGRSARFHKGVDLPAARGTPVLAAAAGIVVLTTNEGAYGRYIVIDHGNGYRTLYAHLLEFDVRRGDRVAAGQRIARVGKSGNATGYHLHYEVHRNGQLADPIGYLPR